MSQKNINIVILYTELAGYTLACLDGFVENYPAANVHLVRWPVNSEAPFSFSFNKKLRVFERDSLDDGKLLDLVDSINPDVVFCSGWIDKGYRQVCRKWRKKVPVVLLMDNKWHGTLKQHVASLTSEFTIKKMFSHAWVPGKDQKEYALRLGFAEDHICTGFYSGDTKLFSGLFQRYADRKMLKFPHRFIYVGRYYDFKGVNELWAAFSEFKARFDNDWELYCIGNGDIEPYQHQSIKHLGFIQPKDLEEVVMQTGVFVLPSKVEPWGVVVHEFAAAGFPLLLSDSVGAKTAFLMEGCNGYSFQTSNFESIIVALHKMTQLSDDELFSMGKFSNNLAQSITTNTWAETLYSFVPKA